MPARNSPAEERKRLRAGLFIGVVLTLIALVVILTQVPWVLQVYHGPRPITVDELRQCNGQPTRDYVAFEVSETIETDVTWGYNRGKTLSRFLFVRIGDEWVFAHVPITYRGGTLVGFVKRNDDRRSGRDMEALGRVKGKFPSRPLLPYVIQAEADQKHEVVAFFSSMGFFLATGLFLIWTFRRKLSALAKARQPFGCVPRPAVATGRRTQPPVRGRSPRQVIGWLYLLIIAGLVVGAAAFGKHIVAEHRRLSFWDGFWVWIGDGVALFWATVYFVRHTLLRVPPAEPSGTTRWTWFLWVLALLSILASLGTDLWKTTALVQSEREAFETAKRTVGTIHSVTKTPFPHRTAYSLHCSYTGANGIAYRADFFVRDPDELPKLAPGVVKAVRAEQFPVAVAIAYDEERPQRSWLADLGLKEKNRILSGFSIGVLLFQTFVAVFFLAALAVTRASTGRLPWWHDMHGVILVAVEAGLALFIGTLVLIGGMPIVWGGGEDM